MTDVSGNQSGWLTRVLIREKWCWDSGEAGWQSDERQILIESGTQFDAFKRLELLVMLRHDILSLGHEDTYPYLLILSLIIRIGLHGLLS